MSTVVQMGFHQVTLGGKVSSPCCPQETLNVSAVHSPCVLFTMIVFTPLALEAWSYWSNYLPAVCMLSKPVLQTCGWHYEQPHQTGGFLCIGIDLALVCRGAFELGTLTTSSVCMGACVLKQRRTVCILLHHSPLYALMLDLSLHL